MPPQEEAVKSAFEESGLKEQGQDPFPARREESGGLLSSQNQEGTTSGEQKVDRTFSTDEWDASKTLPSRFQQPKGSIFATPGSRDGHVDKNTDRDAAYHAKLAEKGWVDKVADKFRRGSRDDSEGTPEEK